MGLWGYVKIIRLIYKRNCPTLFDALLLGFLLNRASFISSPNRAKILDAVGNKIIAFDFITFDIMNKYIKTV